MKTQVTTFRLHRFHSPPGIQKRRLLSHYLLATQLRMEWSPLKTTEEPYEETFTYGSVGGWPGDRPPLPGQTLEVAGPRTMVMNPTLLGTVPYAQRPIGNAVKLLAS